MCFSMNQVHISPGVKTNAMAWKDSRSTYSRSSRYLKKVERGLGLVFTFAFAFALTFTFTLTFLFAILAFAILAFAFTFVGFLAFAIFIYGLFSLRILGSSRRFALIETMVSFATDDAPLLSDEKAGMSKFA